MAGVADKNALKAGLFIIFSLVLAIAVFWTVSGVDLGNRQTRTIRFELAQDVSGLAAGSEVRVGGLKKGRVHDVRLDDEGNHVLVDVELPEDVVLRQDPVVAVQSTVTGVSWVNFSHLGAGEPLADETVIEGEISGVSAVVASITELGPSLSALAGELREDALPRLSALLDRAGGTLDTVDSTFTDVGGKAGKAIDRADRTVERIDDLLADNRSTIDQTLESLRDASQRMPALVDETRDLVATVEETAVQLRTDLDDTSQRLRGILDSTAGVVEKADRAADDTAITLREVRGIIQGNRGKIEQIITRTTDASRTLNLAATEIRRSPWRLLYRPDGRQRESMDLYDAARQFADGAGALQDAAIALEDAAEDPTAGSEDVRRLLIELQERFENFDRIEREFFEKLK